MIKQQHASLALRLSTSFLLGLLILLIAPQSVQAQWTTGTNINNTNSGNVGIGTASPGTLLDVSGNIITVGSESGTTGRANNTTKLARVAMPPFASASLRFALLGGATTSTANIAAIGGEVGGMAAATQVDFVTAATTNVDTGTVRMTVNNVGNVGIGTTGPDTRLSVVGPGTTIPITYNVGDVATFVTPTDGPFNVAIVKGGVTNPQELSFGVNQASHYSEIQAAHSGVTTNTLILNRQGGNVGIGMTSPSEKLEVSGNIKVTGTGNINASGTVTAGNIIAKYQDVAEWVPASRALPAGTVVTLDPTRSNHVEASSKAYDTRVAGVISAQPGIALGERSENKVLVATTGRVKLKVDASHGSILVGDLLVTSDVKGFAMKSQPISLGGVQIHRPGTLIGKALEPLAKGRGEILVLLSLQ